MQAKVSTYTPCNIILNVAAPIFKCEQAMMQAVLVVLITLPYCKKQKQKLLHPFGENKTLSAESETLRSSPNAELKKV